jgi:hypothetical protein
VAEVEEGVFLGLGEEKSRDSMSPVGIEMVRGPKAMVSNLSKAFIEVSTIAFSMSTGQSMPSISV